MPNVLPVRSMKLNLATHTHIHAYEHTHLSTLATLLTRLHVARIKMQLKLLLLTSCLFLFQFNLCEQLLMHLEKWKFKRGKMHYDRYYYITQAITFTFYIKLLKCEWIELKFAKCCLTFVQLLNDTNCVWCVHSWQRDGLIVQAKKCSKNGIE